MWFQLNTTFSTHLGALSTLQSNYGVTYSLSNFTKTTAPDMVEKDKSLTVVLTMAEGATFATASMTDGTNTVDGSLSGSTVTMTISSVKGPVTVIARATSVNGDEGDDDTTGPTPDGTISVTWEQGAIDSGNGPNASGATMTNRARTQGYIQVNSSIIISCSGNAEFCPIYYKADKTYISSPNVYQTDTLTVDGSTYPLVRIMIRDKSNTNATMSATFGENYMTITGDGVEIPYSGSTSGDTDINGIHDGATWVVGAIQSDNGTAVDSMKTRIRTGYIPLGSVTVSVSNTAEFCPFLYDSNKKFKSSPAVYQTTTQTFTSADGAYLVLMARNKDATTTTLTADYGNNISIVTA